jgi:hypothetical protein
MVSSMPMPPSKISILRGFMARSEWVEAVRLAARFPSLGDEKESITRAWAAHSNPGFYRQIGRNPEAEFAAGVDALKRRYA